ncbi:hypothetical protein ACFQ58_17170 [Agromyces sp. NPDC056523]|uniref:hypothetical protein n=1 Tax=Agromyces sp. NPDC056523 TaxID=3345850 RepID=UPI00366DD321
MAIDDVERSELEARVYSRAGAADARVEHVDPLTGQTRLVTESEWRLLQADREEAAAAAAAARSAPADRSRSDPAPSPARDDAASTRAAVRGRRRAVPWRAAVAGAATATAIIATWSWMADAAARVPDVEVTIEPDPSAAFAVAAGIPDGAALDVFRDADRVYGDLPGWLNVVFPVTRVAQLVGPEEPIRGASVYAAIAYDEVACLIVRLEATGMSWNCTSVERLVGHGMTMRTSIPSDLASGEDPDGDGVAGVAERTALLEIEWNADGTFRIARSAG